MMDSALLVSAVGFLMTGVVTALGYMVRRAIAIHDTRELETHRLLDTGLSEVNETLRAILVENKLTNHRITELEVKARVAKAMEDHHQHRVD